MSEARELDLALMMADLCGYTALTETHGALQASETVLRFVGLVEASLEPGVRVVDSIGDAVFCAGEDTRAVLRTALRLRDAAARESGFPRISTGLHHGRVVERNGRLFGAPINLTARLTSHAAGDQILCTEQIVKAIGPGEGMECRVLGEREFKNVLRPVAVFELTRTHPMAEIEFVDPVCRMQVGKDSIAATRNHAGRTYRFCSADCARAFSEAPERYLGGTA
jgi:adenylate cyclase